MSWLTVFLKSTVGRKFVMAVTGLFLCFFLVMHLAGNLLLYVGGEAYDNYAHMLHSNEELLLIVEVLLYVAFALHIALAFVTTAQNSSTRRIGYRKNESKRPDRSFPLIFSADYTMMLTGLIGLAFLTVHLSDFKFEIWWSDAIAGQTPAEKAFTILSSSWRQGVYLLGSIALGIHVSHGLASACQTIGFNHRKYTPTVKWLSVLFGVIVAIGFSSFPILVNVPEVFDFITTPTP